MTSPQIWYSGFEGAIMRADERWCEFQKLFYHPAGRMLLWRWVAFGHYPALSGENHLKSLFRYVRNRVAIGHDNVVAVAELIEMLSRRFDLREVFARHGVSCDGNLGYVLFGLLERQGSRSVRTLMWDVVKTCYAGPMQDAFTDACALARLEMRQPESCVVCLEFHVVTSMGDVLCLPECGHTFYKRCFREIVVAFERPVPTVELYQDDRVIVEAGSLMEPTCPLCRKAFSVADIFADLAYIDWLERTTPVEVTTYKGSATEVGRTLANLIRGIDGFDQVGLSERQAVILRALEEIRSQCDHGEIRFQQVFSIDEVVEWINGWLNTYERVDTAGRYVEAETRMRLIDRDGSDGNMAAGIDQIMNEVIAEFMATGPNFVGFTEVDLRAFVLDSLG